MSFQSALLDKLALPATSLLSFKQQLEDIADGLADVERSGKLDTKTKRMVTAVGDFANSLCMALLGLHIDSKPIMQSVPPLISNPAVPESSSNDPVSQSRSNYTESAYRWLIDHLYNPYPSAVWRDRLAKESGARRKDIDNWFKTARQKIGWTMIREAYFKTRKEMIQSATLHFLEPDITRPLETRIIREFEVMRIKAKEMYNLDPTQLALQMDQSMAEHTHSPLLQAEDPRTHARQTVDGGDSAPAPYPSPPQSPQESPLPSTDSQDFETAGRDPFLEVPNSPVALVTRKRCIREDDNSDTEPRVNKRLKLSSLFLHGEALPSPPPSPENSGVKDIPSLPSPPEFSTNLCSNPKKRRLSESVDQRGAKRQLRMPAGPLLRSVSDPNVYSSTAGTELRTQSSPLPIPPVTEDEITPSTEADPPLLPCIILELSRSPPLLANFRPPTVSDDDWRLLNASLTPCDTWFAQPIGCVPSDTTHALGVVDLDFSWSFQGSETLASWT